MKNDEEKDDIFKEAARNSFNNASNNIRSDSEVPAETINTEKQELSQAEIAFEQTKKGDKWDDLAHYVSNDGAKRLLDELKAMPSKDYVRNYLKLLEHFKPKLVRSDSSPTGEEDKRIEIELVQKLPSGEVRTIKINRNED